MFRRELASGDHTYKKKIGYVQENADIYDNLTASEYILFVGELYGMEREWAEEKARKLMQQFGLEDVLHTRIASFSKGMRQKVRSEERRVGKECRYRWVGGCGRRNDRYRY